MIGCDDRIAGPLAARPPPAAIGVDLTETGRLAALRPPEAVDDNPRRGAYRVVRCRPAVHESARQTLGAQVRVRQAEEPSGSLTGPGQVAIVMAVARSHPSHP